jgi:hypothetical protein
MNAMRFRWLWAALLLCVPLSCVPSLARTYDKGRAVAYAQQYAQNPNPAFPFYSDNDCTNFVSQALLVGGWGFEYAPYDSVTGWYFVPGAGWLNPQDDCWYNADYLFHFLLYSNRGVLIGWGNKDNPGNVGALQPGDLIFADWYKNGTQVGNDGRMDHAMIVTKKDADGTVRVSYHSINHIDRPIREVMNDPNTGQYGRYFYFRMHTQLDVAQATTVVSESSTAPYDGAAGFFRHGTPRYWRDAWGVGDGGHMLWTWNNASSTDNVGDWRPNLAVDGFYEVYVFIPRLHGTTAQARYQVYSADGRTDVVVNQNNIYDAWASLGTHWFNSGTGGLVRLADATGERGITKQIAFDTAVWVPRN